MSNQTGDRSREPVLRLQTVNISPAVLERFAREKLREALVAKLGYSRLGVLASEETVGQYLSVKA